MISLAMLQFPNVAGVCAQPSTDAPPAKLLLLKGNYSSAQDQITLFSFNHGISPRNTLGLHSSGFVLCIVILL
jgi:hypothetical protein